MRRFFLPLALSVGWAFAAPAFTPDFSGFTCNAAVAKKLAEWGSTNRWQAAPTMLSNGVQYLSPSKTFGVWIAIEHRMNTFAAFKISQISNEQTRVVEFDKDCSAREQTETNEPYSEANYLTDLGIAQLMKEHARGLIYVWHPAYSYSIATKGEFEKVAQNLGYAFTTVLGRGADARNLNDLLLKNAFSVPQAIEASVELSLRTSSTHYPRVYLYKNKKLARAVILGAMPANELEKRVKELEKQL